MPRQSPVFQTFNRGEVSGRALARLDVERLRVAAATMVNWMPLALGPMRFRGGTKYIGSTLDDEVCQMLPFIAATDDVALIELTNADMRVWIDDALVTRVSVSTSISNGSFATSTDWTTSGSSRGGTVAFGGNGLQLQPVGNGGIAKCTREITVAGGDQNKEHTLILVVPFGFDGFYFRVGSSAGDDDYVEETYLLAGEHHLSFTPTGNFHLTIWAKDRYGVEKRLTSIAVAGAGNMEVTSLWATAQLGTVIAAQSADVVYAACKGIRPQRIERRGDGRSWSLVDYVSRDGPVLGKTLDVQLKPAATYGRTTLAADQDFFRAEHVGTIMRLFHGGQNFSMYVAGDGYFTDPIRVAGVAQPYYNEREFSVTVAGTWVGTIHVMRSIVGPDEGYGAYPREAGSASTEDITANATHDNEDEDDNLVVYYKVGFEDGDYTSGIALVTFAYPYGGGEGIFRIVAFNSATSVDVEVLKAPKGATYTPDWSEGAWSSYRGYPMAVCFFGGRLFWFGSGGRLWGTVVNSWSSLDQDNLNDDGPIVRELDEGPVDNINFGVGLDYLIVGTPGGEFVLHPTNDQGILTPTSIGSKTRSTFGSKAQFPAIKYDQHALFLDRNGYIVHQLTAVAAGPEGYETRDLNSLHPKILKDGSGVVDWALQRRPDSRLHCVLSDGTVAILVYDMTEEVIAWYRFQAAADGEVENVVIVPGADEDAVYYVVKRTINSGTKRYLEKLATEDESSGATESYMVDCATYQTGLSSATTISNLSHLEGETVVVWADGAAVVDSNGDVAEFTVASGAIDISTELPGGCDAAVVGLPYTGDWKSVKLAYAAAQGTALNRQKRVDQIGLILGTAGYGGLKFGRDFSNLLDMPEYVDGGAVAAGAIFEDYDQPMIPFGGEWTSDARLCLRAVSPYPAEVQAVTFDLETSG